ncbi:peroxisome biogenesis factor 10 [Chytridiales sp. JEL 0842]|nr:peroxisome biogenesis factor 10 [Chytridiales sp. JEL 0842]
MNSAQPKLNRFPHAFQPDIVRAHQKDEYYQRSLQDQLSYVIRSIIGTRAMLKYQKETELLSNAIYFGLTTLLGDTSLRSKAILLASDMGPWMKKVLFNQWNSMHLAIFYLTGSFYDFSKRITGIRYIFTRQLREGEEQNGYEILGVLIVLQLIAHAYMKAFARKEEEQAAVDYDDYNCKQPGHNSKDCQEERAPKTCFRCQSTDHLSKDCPEKISAQAADRANATCFRCNTKGHFARDCHIQPAGGASPPRASWAPAMGTRGDLTCRNCGAVGHFARECPSSNSSGRGGAPMGRPVSSVTCLRCGGVGHMARNCSSPQQCYQCKKTGHISKDCPMGGVSGKRCYTCGEVGHQARDCNQSAGGYSAEDVE